MYDLYFCDARPSNYIFVIFRVFGYEGKVADDIIYANWLSLIWNGAAKATEMYQPDAKAWLQVLHPQFIVSLT